MFFNICLTGYLNYRLWKYIGNPKNNIASHTLTSDMVSISIKRSLVTPAVFFIIAGSNLFCFC